MATSGALSGFLQAMLQLRAQRLQEEEAKQRSSAAGMQSLMSGITGAAGSIMGGFKQAGQDQMYNQLSTEAFGKPVMRATSANAGVQSAADLAASQMRGGLDSSAAFGPQFTGGKEGFEARMQLMELKNKIGEGKAADVYKAAANDRAERYYDLAAGKAAAASRAAELKARNDAFEGMSKTAQEIYKDSEGYLKSASGIRKDIDESLRGEGNQAIFNQKATELMALNALHKGRKLSVPLVDVPAFFPENQQGLLQDYLTAQGAARERAGREAGGQMGPKGVVEDIRPGVSVPYPGGAPRYAPPNTPLPAEMVNRLATGARATEAEAAQLGVPYPAAAQGPQAPAAQGPQAAPAPGAKPLIYRNKKTGARAVWNPRTGQMEPIQ